ncbi:MAG: PEP-CTERM sorting domain-containing protein [Fimbriimonadaceae bacterium]
MTKRIYALAALAVATTPAFATDLWNQQAGLPVGFNAFADSVLGDIPNSSVYDLSDVIVGANGWTVNSISMEVVDQGPGATSLTQAVLNVFANTGQTSLPAVQNNPTTGTTVAVTMTAVAGQASVYMLTASGLNLSWAPGEYWVGLTGLSNYNSAPGQIQTGYSAVNSAGASFGSVFNDPGGQLVPAGWTSIQSYLSDPTADYSAIDIQGVSPAPEPASMTFLGLGVLGIISRRRNRK